jgi:DNA-binding XRE family transcriptional regulator
MARRYVPGEPSSGTARRAWADEGEAGLVLSVEGSDLSVTVVSHDQTVPAAPRSTVIQPRTLGEALRLLQRRAGLNRDDMARLVGVSSGSLSNYLNDASTPSASMLRRIVALLAHRLGLEGTQLWVEFGDFLDRTREASPE